MLFFRVSYFVDRSANDGKTTWDQFAVNERLFGVKTTYEEEMYRLISYSLRFYYFIHFKIYNENRQRFSTLCNS